MLRCRRWRAAACLFLLASGAAVAVGVTRTHIATSASQFKVRRHDLPNLSPFNMTFSPATPAGGTVPEDQAISAAIANTAGLADGGGLPSNVNVAAEYGSFTDTAMARPSPSGSLHLLYQNVPVWIVTFWGPGITAVSSNPSTPPPSSNGGSAEYVVVDASTGSYLLTFS